MFTKRKATEDLLLVLLFLVAIALSIKGLREPDLWWQIRTGEWILEHLQVPTQDVFSYTFAGANWFNIKWLSEVLLALVSKATGPEWVFLLQAVVTVALLWVMLSTIAFKDKSEDKQPYIMALLLLLPAMEYRIIGRPEMFSHLWSAIFLYVLLRYRAAPSKSIWWLVALQILWANLHEAFGMGIVLTAIFVAGAWAEYLFTQKKKLSTQATPPKVLSLVLAVQVASLIINPRGWKLFTQPLQIFGQVFANKYTTELFDFRTPEYWQWNVYWLLGILLIGAAGNVLHWQKLRSKTSKIRLVTEHYGIAYFMVLLAFGYLALTAYRNVVFMAIVAFPFVAFGFSQWWQMIFAKEKIKAFAIPTVALSGLVFYVLIVSNVYYKLTNSRDRFGFQVLSDYNPVQAADFIEKQQLKGTCFSDYLTSSYMLWRLQPDFKTFIDLRDLDVFPSPFFNTFAEAVTFPEEFEKQDSIHHFDYILLYRPQFAALHKHLYNNSRFQMAYLDNVAVIYTPKDKANTEKAVASPRPSQLGTVLNLLLNPLFNSTNKPSEADSYATSASYFLSVGSIANAENSLRQAPRSYQTLQLLGEVKYSRAMQPGNTDSASTGRDAYLSEALAYYVQSLQLKENYGPTHLGLGAVYFQQQNYLKALEYFEKSVEYDNTNLNAWLFAAECCKVMVNRNNDESADYARRAIAFLQQAERLNPDNPPMMLNIGFLYFRLNDCENTRKYLLPIKDFQGFGPEQKASIAQCLNKCAG